MGARFDHLVVAVEDLHEAAARWRAAGLPVVRGGRHRVGTENVLVRGPQPAYVELIAVGSDESNPWLDRVRSARGPISWAVAVDDVEEARAALVAAGFAPSPAVAGSRTTPDGEVVEWKVCDVGPGPYDDSLPFLIEWTTPMPPGPADGPVVAHVALAPSDPDRVADLLLALGFAPSRHWPRRMLHDAGGGVSLTLGPPGEPENLGEGTWTMTFDDPDDPDEPEVSIAVMLPVDEVRSADLDGLRVTATPDRRRFPAASLLPAVDAAFTRLRGDLADWPDPHPGGAPPAEDEYSRRDDPGRYRLLAARADAWVEAIAGAGLGTAEAVDPASVAWADEQHLTRSRATVLRSAPGTRPIVVGLFDEETFVKVGVGEPASVLTTQPPCGCDACDDGSARLLDEIDDAFVLALSGGVYVVRGTSGVVTRSLQGWSSTGVEAGERWLAEAAEGRRTDGVVAGDSWIG